MSRKLIEFTFGSATVIVSKLKNYCTADGNNGIGRFEFKITVGSNQIFKRSYDKKSNSRNSKIDIDNQYSFSFESDYTRVLFNFYSNDKKRAEVGIKFSTNRLSFVQDIEDNQDSNTPTTNSVVFAYTGDDQFYKVPSDVKSITVECWGAGGATQGATGSSYVIYNSGGGGGGGYTKAKLSNVNDQNLKIVVGGGGITGSAGKLAPATYGGGGSQVGGTSNYGTASGGGRSAVQKVSNGIYNDIVTAGGGGGAGVVENYNQYQGYCAGGAGGSNLIGTANLGIFSDGGDAENNIQNSIHGGTGGTQTTGGMNGVIEYGQNTSAYNASLYTGGGGVVYGAGGGGGYYGGGYGGLVTNLTQLNNDTPPTSDTETDLILSDNLVLWLDASDISTIITSSGETPVSGDSVTQWNDKSKSKANATPFVGNSIYNSKALNSLPGIELNETSLYSPIQTGTFNNGVTFFIVFSSTGNQSYNTLINRSDLSNENYAGPWDIHNNSVYIGNSSTNSFGNATISNFTLATNIEPSIAVFQASNDTPVNYWLNNDHYTNGNFLKNYQDTGSYIYIGSRADEVTSIDGVMSEIMVFDSILTNEQIEKIQLHLSKKWGIAYNNDSSTNSGVYNSSGSWLLGGGGGGSSFVDTRNGSVIEMKQALGSAVAGNSNLPSSVQNTIGNGAPATNNIAVGANGQNGYVVLTLNR